jgi:uncharacterized protein YraI
VKRAYLTGMLALATPLTVHAAETGHTIDQAPMLAGPGQSPEIQRLRSGELVTVFGCSKDHKWCEVRTSRGPGWVAADLLEVTWHGRHLAVTNAAVHLPMLDERRTGSGDEQRSAGGRQQNKR